MRYRSGPVFVVLSGWIILFGLIAAKTKDTTPAPPNGIYLPGKIEQVTDGDTVKVSLEVPLVDIRFKDCRVPEIKTKRGKKAYEDLKAYAEGEECFVFLQMVDYIRGTGLKPVGSNWSMNRWVGHVWLQKSPNKTLSEWQVEKGNAAKSLENGKDWGK